MDKSCKYCGEIVYSYSDDPRDIPDTDVCDVCDDLLGRGVPANELKNSPLREESRRTLKEAEQEIMKQLNKSTEDTFNKLWSKEKHNAKNLSKRELAKTFYALGMASAFAITHLVNKQYKVDKTKDNQ